MLPWVFSLLISAVYVSGQSQENVDRCPNNLQRGQYLHTHGNFCYEFTLNKHNYWRNAKEYCAKEGGYLVKIDNMDQELFLVSTLTHLGFHGKAIWIGLNDINQEGVYTWANGEMATFTYWAPGEPSFTHNFEDCVAMRVTTSGHWHDYPCQLPILDDFSWICQYVCITKSKTTFSPEFQLPKRSPYSDRRKPMIAYSTYDLVTLRWFHKTEDRLLHSITDMLPAPTSDPGIIVGGIETSSYVQTMEPQISIGTTDQSGGLVG